MIELIAAAVSGAVVGMAITRAVVTSASTALHTEYLETLTELNAGHASTIETLHALRSNCFIPDERGVKVRYSQASVERRVKAETPRADKV